MRIDWIGRCAAICVGMWVLLAASACRESDGTAAATSQARPSASLTAAPPPAISSSESTAAVQVPSEGQMHPRTTVICNDFNPCTSDYYSVFLGRCIYTPLTGPACTRTCYTGSTCNNGTCSGGAPMMCFALDQCHTAGACSMLTGRCSNPTKSDGTPCNDGNACSWGDACQSGVCTAGSWKSCVSLNPCQTSACNPATGACDSSPKADGTTCDDGNACSWTDTCQSGVCTGGSWKWCVNLNPCQTSACNPTTGACDSNPKADGTTCNDGNGCTQADACQGGTCVGSNPVVCTALDQCHTAGTCDTSTGVCSNPTKSDGTTCDDGNACTQADTCQGGTCTGANPKTCAATDQCHDVGTCDPGTGNCSNPLKNTSDDDGCTLDWCDPVTGMHHSLASGALCSDGNVCNGTETCSDSGTCVAGTPISVDDGDPCTVDTCDEVTGVKHVAVVTGADKLPIDDGKPNTLDFCDPATGNGWHIAVPALDRTVATLAYDATRFLYTSNPPVQQGVVDGTIDKVSAALVRGKVVGRDGVPIPNVRIDINGFGHTVTRPDGNFDMAVNGGGARTVHYSKAGYLPVDRQVSPGWNDYKVVDDVVMIPRDPVVSEVDLGAVGIQVARGSMQTDDDGSRQAVVMFSQGTQATKVLADGTEVPLGTLHVRATEYTVGDDGPKTMPAPLPPNSGYTYAVELSVDEALEDGSSVQFTNTDSSMPHSVFLYVDNFVGFDVGDTVPTGYYDHAAGAWKASDSGVVIRIVEGGSHVDIDGDGQPDDESTLEADYGFTPEELNHLPLVYAPGTTVWRVPIDHFSSWDCNWGFGPPADATPPAPDDPKPGDPEPDPCKNDQQNGSIIGCRRQTLGETLPIAGTPFSLDYTSDRAAGRVGAYSLDIPLRGDSLPPGVTAMELHVGVAGRELDYQYSGATLATTHQYVAWDGADAWGRKLPICRMKGPPRLQIMGPGGPGHATGPKVPQKGPRVDPFLGSRTAARSGGPIVTS